MEIVVGTYDEVLIGFRVIPIGKILQLETNFTDNSHTGCIKCIAISPKGVLASGSTDETIRVLNLKKNQEVGSLIHHSGSITSLEFQKNFLFSTSEDKTLCIWKASNWECLKTFSGHKYAVNSVAVHPSGKLALTVGVDKKLMTWNLITGRSAYITNIKEVAEIVKWSPDGEMYLIVVNNKIDVYSVQTADVKSTMRSECRINCLEFYNKSVCVYGGEGGKIMFHNFHTNTHLYTCDSSTARIKGLCVTKSPLNEKGLVLCVGRSDGRVQIHEIIEEDDAITMSLLVDHNASFRITCMGVYNNMSSKPHELEEGVVDISESVEDSGEGEDDDNKRIIKETTKDIDRKGKRDLDIDDDDLNLVAKSLYDAGNAKEPDVKRVKKDVKKEKSISFSETVTVVQENDTTSRKEMRKKRREEILKSRRLAKRKEARKMRLKLEKFEKVKKNKKIQKNRKKKAPTAKKS